MDPVKAGKCFHGVFLFRGDQTDVDDRLISTSYTNPINPTPNVSYQYDLVLGRLTSMTDGTGTTTYQYGTIGQIGGNQVTSITQPVGTTTANITYTYDADSRVISRAIDGVAESYGYNGTAQLMSVTNPLGSFGYAYDPSSSRLTQVQYPNGQQTNYDYFSATDPNGASGSLKDITNMGGGSTSGQVLSKFSYAYNPTGEIKTWGQQLDNNSSDAKSYGIGYDPDSEVQAVTLASGASGFDNLTTGQAVTYGYDASGNRTTESAPSYLHTFAPNNLNQLASETDKPISISGATNRAASVTVNGQAIAEDSNFNYKTTIQPANGSSTPLTVQAVAADGTVTIQKSHILNTVPFSSDANGNMTSDGSKNYSWDAANRLVGVSILGPQPPTMADNVQMIYDGKGQRVGITEKHGSIVINDWRFVWCRSGLCEQRNSTGNVVVKRFYTNGEFIEVSSTKYFYTFDHLRSVREMTDSSGDIRGQFDYDPFGRQNKLSGDLVPDFGYTGFYLNQSSGLCFTYYRAYDSEKGRWLNRDPEEESRGLNMYEYVFNSPMDFIDPLGLDGLHPQPLPTPTPIPGPKPTPMPGSSCSKGSCNSDLNNCIDAAWNDFKNSVGLTTFILAIPAGSAAVGCAFTGPACPACIAAVEQALLYAVGPGEVAILLGEIKELNDKINECHKKFGKGCSSQ